MFVIFRLKFTQEASSTPPIHTSPPYVADFSPDHPPFSAGVGNSVLVRSTLPPSPASASPSSPSSAATPSSAPPPPPPPSPPPPPPPPPPPTPTGRAPPTARNGEPVQVSRLGDTAGHHSAYQLPLQLRLGHGGSIRLLILENFQDRRHGRPRFLSKCSDGVADVRHFDGPLSGADRPRRSLAGRLHAESQLQTACRC